MNAALCRMLKRCLCVSSGVHFLISDGSRLYYIPLKKRKIIKKRSGTIMAGQVEDGEFHPTGCSQENGPEPPVPMPQNESFNREQTVFLIDLIRHHLLNEGQGFPKTLYELNSRLKSAMGSRKVMWEDAAEQLSSHFMESFQPQRVARKWYTLVDGYTKARGLISAGKDSTRFQFYSEMDDILGNIVCEQHDEVYPVVVTPEVRGMRVPKPQISLSSFKAFSKTAYKPSFSPYRGMHSPQFVPAAPVVQIQENEGFSREHILFLIDLMRQHIITEGEGLPKTLEELDERLKSAMANKKRLWEDASKQLSGQFMEYFYPDKIAKKWSSLVQGYKNVCDRDRITGQKNSMRFRFYSEMDELFDKRPDDVLSVVTTDAQEEARPETDAQKASRSDAAELNDNPPKTGSCQETLDAALNLESVDSTCSQSESPRPSFSQSDSFVPMEENESFTRDQTLFLIDLMRQLIENEGDGPPKTLKELNRRLKAFRGGKKELWKDTAEKMAAHFRKCFNPQRVARKWLTLIEAYTRVRENILVKGTDSTRFHFYSEMDALMAEQHNLPLSTGVPRAGQRSRMLKPMSVSRLCRRRVRVRAPANDEDEDYSLGLETQMRSPRKRRREEDDLLQFLREAEEANQRRHRETMVQLKSIQSLLTKLIDKL